MLVAIYQNFLESHFFAAVGSKSSCLYKLIFSFRMLILGAENIKAGSPRARFRTTGKSELFHSNHSGHTGSIFLHGRCRARVVHRGLSHEKQ